MRNLFNTLLVVLSAAAWVGCVRDADQQEAVGRPEITPGLMRFVATTEEEDLTRTSTDADGVHVFWSAHEDINIFYGDSNGNKFTSDNEEPASTAGFNGFLSAFIGTNNIEEASYFWGVYPYQEDSESDGSSVTVTLAGNQTAKKNTYADKMLVTVAKALGLALNFKHVCSGYKFKVVNPLVTSMTFKGNNGEIVAGKVRVSMNSEGVPIWEPIEGEGLTEVTISAPEGEVLDTDALYYLIILPQTFEHGFTMTFRTRDLKKGDYVRDESVTFTRSIFKKNLSRDATVVYQDIYQAVDLGLSVKWANVNIGAETPEEVGNYYAWGELEPKTNYSWSTYRFANGSNNTLTKYNSDSSLGSVVDNKTVLDAEDDIATVTIGEGWRTPTREDWNEFFQNTTRTSSTLNGQTGQTVTSKADPTAAIFIPSTGHWDGPSLGSKANYFYWSSTRHDTSNQAYRTMMNSGCGPVSRHYGMVVRAVQTIPVALVSLNKTALSLHIDDSETLVATITPAKVTNPTLTWTSSAPSVATVDANGTVTAISTGTATITVRAGNQTATCAVTVTEVGDLETPLCLEAVDNGEITVTNPKNITIEYKVNGGNWVPSAESTISIAVSAGDRVYFRGDNATYTDSDDVYTNIACSAKTYIYGNIMSLISSTGFATCKALTEVFTFGWLFYGNANLYNDPVRKLMLPATTLTSSCYRGMFKQCTHLSSSPALPATKLNWGVYKFMFSGCVALTEAPELPCMDIASNAYGSMFYGCTSLVTPPALPATKVGEMAYANMFQNCTNMTTAPDLPATTLGANCYNSMFYNCRKITTAPALPATTLKDRCYKAMFYGCTSLTSAPALPATTLTTECYYQMFRDCTSLENAPALPATTLASSCYFEMFRYNIKMVTAPSLPATELTASCYKSMFYACYKLTGVQEVLPATTLQESCYETMFSPVLPAETLAPRSYNQMFASSPKVNYIKMLALDISATDAVTNWVSGVASTGTFVKDFDATWDVVGVDGVPSGWNVETVFTREQIHVTGVSLNKTSLSLNKDVSEQLTATVVPTNADIQDLAWSSSDATVASVNQNGNVTALKKGTTRITVRTVDGNREAYCDVTVRVPVSSVTLNKSTLSFASIGAYEKLIPTVNPSDASDKSVTWSTSASSVATVASDGTVTARGSGTAEITVRTTDGGKTAKCTVSVAVPVSSVSVSPSSLSLTKGSTSTLVHTVLPANATNKAVTWSSENTAVASVNQSGLVTAVGGGSTSIKVETADGGKVATCDVTVTVPVTGVSLNKSSLTLRIGYGETLTKTIQPSDATNPAVTWSSSNNSIATVSTTGLVRGISVGTAVVTVRTADGSYTANCTVTVTPINVTGVSLNQTTLSMSKGDTFTLVGTVSPTNATNQNVSWSSDNTAVATVDENGLVTAVAPGEATIVIRPTRGGINYDRVSVTVKVK